MINDLSATEVVNHELGRFNSNYYRDKFRRLVVWLWFMVLVNMVLIAAVVYLCLTVKHDPHKFYASNIHNGVVTEVYPLSNPMVKPAKLLDWVEDTVVKSYNFNFTNYRDVFVDIQDSFTSTGWQEYQSILKNSPMLDNFINQRLFLTARATTRPILISDGVEHGYYEWKVQIPLQIAYSKSPSSNDQIITQKNITVSVIVVRIPNLGNTEEVAITHFEIGANS
ncbi:MAG: DotI/IcmL family type IV secretion protein [Gammaproteobacteria bacterium]|nr:DotI/IcmL family type IV secretion protein [Gammaproteobacteria bacterium]